MPDAFDKIVLFGVGQTALAVLSALKSTAPARLEIWGTTRAHSGDALQALGVKPILLNVIGDDGAASMKQLKEACADACVLISFPPDEQSEHFFFDTISGARKIIYISSTGVYGSLSGVIDEDSPVDHGQPRVQDRLKAEALWRSAGATILRAAALYGPQAGLHKRLQSGTYRLPGDGSNFVSRIHLDDLAAIILAIFASNSEQGQGGGIYVVGDLKPATHIEVVTWLCEKLNLPLPPSASLTEVNASLSGNRRINSTRVLSDFGIKLAYPTYVEGFSQCLAAADS